MVIRMKKDCLLCGVGGQGTVLASRLIAAAAMNKGLNAATSETIGMAQRGGCVVSHVRVADCIHSPMIPYGGADVIIAFEPAEAVRNLRYLKKDGTVITASKAVKPVTSTLGGASYTGDEMLSYLKENIANLVVIDGDAVCGECGSPKVLNLALLGAAAACGALGLTAEEVESAMKKRVNEKFHVLNSKAIELGGKYVKESE